MLRSACLPACLPACLQISGHTLLERYGMSEFSMGISNPLYGALSVRCLLPHTHQSFYTIVLRVLTPRQISLHFPLFRVIFSAGVRKPNSVGFPLPGYQARIVPEDPADLTPPSSPRGSGAAATVGGVDANGEFAGPGELQLKGPAVFKQYWNRPDATAASFTPDGWFQTGDCAVRDADGYYSILGRLSADIIKSGGYKISALDIERVLLGHPDVSEAAVLGLPDPVYGEKVSAVLVLKSGATGSGEMKDCAGLPAEVAAIKAYASQHLPPYQLPTTTKCVAEIPRNAMGKVNKKQLRAALFPAPPKA